ncbi:MULTISPECIES: bifunctional riboflavin kinase/FAD synthetase [Maribacter]|uniref:Riboflavin biosynthesis protein n=2 Tax=Maribacter TaxID=252356 RepID=A0A5R8M6X6_9FLAO|nr:MULTISPECIES: bifunctional riboflavin kinase/FAD synthetase [Maribacter]MDC6403816.1 bifunctional riboflavin kinase/FAD synthetase [Maribacter sp. PR66]MEE1970957.1 bifunctional riboflavin kinase/FAD synthetase [Maribacter flavus]TLF45303.1 bifunctional riboflavin kinase/FAD synthetase [Maribacter aurantiacus]
MITVQSISNYDEKHPVAITIGTFDGVHIGHRKILEKVINRAKNSNLKSAVLTFFPHPRMVLQKDANIKLLNTIDEKKSILEKMGLDILVIHPFTKEFSRLSATEFVRDLLVNKLKSKNVIIGYDHRFGRNRNANITDLIAFGNALDFSVEEIPAQEIDEVSVSSTKIRRALENGDIETANAYLGYEYMLTGTIKKGKGLGRKIHFPTANVHIEETYKLVPKNGSYIIKSHIEGADVFGMMNIGYNPTVNGTSKTIEVHFFDFDADLYDKNLQINLLSRLRDEQKFDSLDELKLQLAKDKEKSLQFISNR